MTNSYRDLSLNMKAHPGTGDISSVRDEAAVAQSIRGLVMTNRYGRFFNLRIGGNLDALLFENWSESVKSEIQNRIRDTIENYEPRADVLNVEATDNTANNAVDITIVYRTKTSNQDAKLNIALKRIF